MKRILLTALAILAGIAHTHAQAPNRPASTATRGYLVTPRGSGPYQLGQRTVRPRAPERGITLKFKGRRLCSVLTDNAAHRTAEGLGVGSTFDEFERAYGAAEVEAATARIYFPGQAETYDIVVSGMPKGGPDKPPSSGRILAFAVTDCPVQPE